MGSLSAAAHERHPIANLEDVGAARRAAARLVQLGAIDTGQAELITTELATNVLRHGDGGYLLLRPDGDGLEIIAVDAGPGINDRPRPDPPRWSAGLGAGLATVTRLATTTDVYSSPAGTTVLARLVPTAGGDAASGLVWGGVNVPLDGEEESGDAWAVRARPDGSVWALVVDGLGHGPQAARAAAVAVREFERADGGDASTFVRRAHEAMNGTRGGVLGLCSLDPAGGRLEHIGVGNVAGRIVNGRKGRGLVSQNGSLGTHLPLPRLHRMSYEWTAGSVLVLSSDGIRSSSDPVPYPGLLGHHPAVIAATLHRDHHRSTDDATVLVVKDDRSRP